MEPVAAPRNPRGGLPLVSGPRGLSPDRSAPAGRGSKPGRVNEQRAVGVDVRVPSEPSQLAALSPVSPNHRVRPPAGLRLPLVEHRSLWPVRQDELLDASCCLGRDAQSPCVVGVPLDRARRHAEECRHFVPGSVPLMEPGQQRPHLPHGNTAARPMAAASHENTRLMPTAKREGSTLDPALAGHGRNGETGQLAAAAVAATIEMAARSARSCGRMGVRPPNLRPR